MEKEWFTEWFDSPYYHILYKKHDEKEAQRTLDNMLSTLNLSTNARVMDLACGKGRHARYLAEKGFDVTGLDISLHSIEYASQFERPGLSFYQHDMRLPFRINYYDAIVNFFTSFGYFDNDADHLKSLKNIHKGLKTNGLLLLDYFNSAWVRKALVPAEIKEIDGIQFHATKRLDQKHVYKKVEFEAMGQSYSFEERVRLFTLSEFETLMQQAGLTIRATYGDYDLNPFDEPNSTRLIIIAEKC
jgi:SAM-dependent methyltransferase